MTDYDSIAAAGGDGAAVLDATPAQRIHAAQQRAAEVRASVWSALQGGRGIITLRTCQLIVDREVRILRLSDCLLDAEAADNAEDLLASIERLASERMTRQ